jgi:SPP1 family predicted phage head-tail adaptor
MPARDPGALRRRLTLEAPVETPDGSGGVIRSFAALGSVWADVTSLSLDEQVRADRNGPRIDHHLVVRRRAGLVAGHRLVGDGRILRIVAVADLDPAGRYRKIAAVEEV